MLRLPPPRPRAGLRPPASRPLRRLRGGAVAQAEVQTRETLNKTTQEVFELKTELAKGAVLAVDRDPACRPAYSGADRLPHNGIAKLGKMRSRWTWRSYEATNGEKPKTYEEFMEVIIKKGKPDGIQLPMLPYYQEYAYDSDKKELVVIEYPAKKKALQDQSDRELGRK